MRKHLHVLFAITVLAGCIAGASANPIPPLQDTWHGIEIFPGIIINNVRYGATFVGTATGDLPGVWSVSINYTPPNPGVGVVNNIVGGQWSLNVVNNGHSVGTLFGRVDRGGTATWNTTGNTATMAMLEGSLTITGGTGSFAGHTGTGQFTGTLSHLTFPPTIAAAITLNVN